MPLPRTLVWREIQTSSSRIFKSDRWFHSYNDIYYIERAISQVRANNRFIFLGSTKTWAQGHWWWALTERQIRDSCTGHSTIRFILQWKYAVLSAHTFWQSSESLTWYILANGSDFYNCLPAEVFNYTRSFLGGNSDHGNQISSIVLDEMKSNGSPDLSLKQTTVILQHL